MRVGGASLFILVVVIPLLFVGMSPESSLLKIVSTLLSVDVVVSSMSFMRRIMSLLNSLCSVFHCFCSIYCRWDCASTRETLLGIVGAFECHSIRVSPVLPHPSSLRGGMDFMVLAERLGDLG